MTRRKKASERLRKLIFLLSLGIFFLFLSSDLFSQSPSVITLPVGNEPRGLAIHPTSLKAVVTHHNGNTVSVIDVVRRTATRLTVGEAPFGVAIDPGRNRAYVTNEGSDSVSVIHLANNQVVATIPVGGNPREIAVHPAANLAIVANSKSDTVSILDLSTNGLIADLPVGVDPEGVVIYPAGNRAYVTHRGSDSVSVIDLITRTVMANLPVGRGPSGIDIRPTTGRIVIANSLSDDVSLIDAATNRLLATIPVGSGPADVAIHPAMNRAYVTNEFSDSVSVIDLVTNQVIATYPVGPNPRGITVIPQINLLLVVNAKGDTITLINLSSPPAGTIVPVGKDPKGVAIDREADRAVTANFKSSDLSIIDLVTQATVATLPTDRGPRDVALHPDTKKLLVTNFRANTLSVIDLPNRTLLAMVPVGKGPAAVAIDPGLNLAAVVNARDGSISLIDLATHTVVGTISVGGRPVDIDIDPERHLAVVADEKRDQAMIIDLATRTTVATIPVGKDPVSVAINPDTHLAAIANRKSNSLSILDLTARRVTATVGPLPTPTGVAIDRSTNIAAVVSHRLNTLLLIDLATNTITTSFTVGPQPEQVAIHPYMNVAVVTHREGVTITPLPNPVPELTALIPNAAGAGESGLTVTLTGKKFVRSATIRFGSQTFPARFVSNEELKVDLPPQALVQTGFVEVSVVHPSPGGGVSNSLTFTIRNTAPFLTALSPASVPAGSGGIILTLSGANFLPAASVSFNNQPLTTTFVSATRLTALLPAAMIATPGLFPIVVVNPPPGGGTSNSLDFQVIGPVIQTISPPRGPAGTVVTIRGVNFDPAAANNRVAFNGKEAIVAAANGTEIVAAVPQGATTGPVTVTTPIGTAIGPAPFEVISSSDFSLSAAPATLSFLQGSSGAAVFSITSTGAELFTGLASLSVSGLPAGMTALFEPPQLTSGRQSVLRISAGSAVPIGNTSLTVTASATVDGKVVTRSASLTVSVVSGGPTTLFGQVLTVDGAPIPGVELHLGAGVVATDAAGNFFFTNVPAGTQKMMVDANAAVAGYPIYAIDLFLIENQINSLPPLKITPPPPPERFTPINNATADQVITDPRYPGASITLPAGVTITGWDGVLKTKIALERLSPDRLPVLPPPGETHSLYQVFFGTPNGGVPSAPLPVTLPNDLELDPGEEAEIWYYDASPLGGPSGWHKAGMGTVSSDGSWVVSNPGVGIERFCGFCGTVCVLNNQRDKENHHPEGPKKGDPVDLAIGRMIVEKTDLVLPGRFPVTISRTYNPIDPFDRIAGVQLGFGLGWYLSVDVVLLELGDLRRIVLPGNSRIDFARQPDGAFVNKTDPAMAGAVLKQLTGGAHELRLKEGAIWRFQEGFVIPGVSLLVQQADRNGNRLTVERGNNGSIARLVDSDNRVLSFTSNGSGRITRITDPLGRSVIYGYDTAGRLASVIDPNGGITQYRYTATGGIVTITDPKGIPFLENFYGASGRVLRQVQADGGEWLFSYEVAAPRSSIGPNCTALPLPLANAGNNIVIPAAIPLPPCPTTESWELDRQGYRLTGGKVVSTTVRDPNGKISTYRFNNLGYPVEIIDPLGQATRYERDSNNQVKSTTDPLGRKRSSTHDAKGNVTSVTDPLGNITRFEYEPAFSRVTKITDPLGQITLFEYDTQGNLIKTTDPLGGISTLTYNPAGQPVGIIDPLGNSTRFEYDITGNLTGTTDPLGNRTIRAYDPVSRLIALTDPRGFATRYQYDLLNRVTQIQDANGGTTRFAYDPNGNLLTVTDAKNQTTTHTYDVMDRLEMRTDPLGRTERYLYDGNNNLTRFTDRKGQVSLFGYDPLNRRAQADFGDGSGSSFLYDAAGRLIHLNDTASGPVDLAYDNLDRLIREITPRGVVDYQYDALGRRTSMTANGQMPVGYQYDGTSRLTQVAQGDRIVGLAYDAAGRRTSLTYPNGTHTNYTYDPASRLTRILHESGAAVVEDLTYTYDAAGNRIGVGRTGPQADLPEPVQAAYDAANELIRFNSSTPNLAYDANGNLIRQTDANGTTAYTWDARNRLTGISGPNVTAGFVYDALGRRVSKTINGARTDYQYDGNDIVAEIKGGAVAAVYLRSLNIDEPFLRSSAIAEYYHADALGSVLALTDQTGATTTSYVYEAFGKTTITGTSTNPFQYTGRENDQPALSGVEGGLYYYRARYYSPQLQRFISEDPLRFRRRFLSHLYWYVANSPLRFIDPFGLEKKRIEVCSGSACFPIDVPDDTDLNNLQHHIRNEWPQELPPEVKDAIKDSAKDLAEKGADQAKDEILKKLPRVPRSLIDAIINELTNPSSTQSPADDALPQR